MMGQRKDHDVPNAAHDAVEESEDKVPAVGVLNLKLNIMMPY